MPAANKPNTAGQGLVSCRNVHNFSVCLQFTVGDDAFHRPEHILHKITFRVDVGIDPYRFAKTAHRFGLMRTDL